MSASEVTPLEADRVIRGGVVEYLGMASSYEAQRNYERDVPDFVDVPAEVIEMWADYFPDDPRARKFTEAFSSDEVDAIREFHVKWDSVTRAVTKRWRKSSGGRHGSLAEVQALPEWEELRVAAETALSRFRSGEA